MPGTALAIQDTKATATRSAGVAAPNAIGHGTSIRLETTPAIPAGRNGRYRRRTVAVADADRLRLGDKDRDLTLRLRLIFGIRRERRHRQRPKASPFRWVLDLADTHRADDGLIAKIDLWIGPQVVNPDRVLGRATLRSYEDIPVAVFDTHQRRFPNSTRLIAPVSHEDHRQPGVAQCGPLGPAATLVKLDLLTYPVVGARNILGHASASISVL